MDITYEHYLYLRRQTGRPTTGDYTAHFWETVIGHGHKQTKIHELEVALEQMTAGRDLSYAAYLRTYRAAEMPFVECTETYWTALTTAERVELLKRIWLPDRAGQAPSADLPENTEGAW